MTKIFKKYFYKNELLAFEVSHDPEFRPGLLETSCTVDNLCPLCDGIHITNPGECQIGTGPDLGGC